MVQAINTVIALLASQHSTKLFNKLLHKYNFIKKSRHEKLARKTIHSNR